MLRTAANKRTRVFMGFSFLIQQSEHTHVSVSGLMRLADIAQTMGEKDSLYQAVERIQLCSPPDDVCAYYSALASQDPIPILHQLADQGGSKMRSRALLSLGTIACRSGNLVSAAEFYHASAAIAYQNHDADTYCNTMKNLGINLSLSGYHRDAVHLLTTTLHLFSRVGFKNPFLFFDLQNSLGLELCAVGHQREALKIAASLYRSKVPEFMKSAIEIQTSERPNTSISVPAIEPPAKVFSIDNYRRRPVAKDPSTRKRLEIFALIADHPDLDPQALQIAHHVLEGSLKEVFNLKFLNKLANHLRREVAKAG